ncbi:MAG: HAD family hydrolase [Patescibacteria group bacterium]
MRKLISFDLDQTLVETTKAHTLAFQMSFKKFGLKTSYNKISKLIDGRHSTEVILGLFPKLNKKQVLEIRNLHHKFLKKTVKYAKPIPGALKVLTALKKKYKLAIVTNCAKEEAFVLLKASKIPKKLFTTIVLYTPDLRPKPFPDEILRAEKLARANADYHIGDSIYDVIAGKKARAITIAVLSGAATRKKFAKYKPHHIIKSIKELPKLLNK